MRNKQLLRPLLLAVFISGGLVSVGSPVFAGMSHADGMPHRMMDQQSGPVLGVGVTPIDFAQLDKLDVPYGVRIAGVQPGGPAQRAGLQAGDVITDLDGKPVFSPQRLQWLVRQVGAEAETTVKIRRDGASQDVKVSFAPPASQAEKAIAAKAPGVPGRSFLGIRMQPLTPNLREAMGTGPGSGVLVGEVLDESPASKAGMQPGDVIVRMDRKAIAHPRDVYRVLDYFDAGETIEVSVIRDESESKLAVEVGSWPKSAAAGFPHHPGVMPHHRMPQGFPYPQQSGHPMVPWARIAIRNPK